MGGEKLLKDLPNSLPSFPSHHTNRDSSVPLLSGPSALSPPACKGCHGKERLFLERRLWCSRGWATGLPGPPPHLCWPACAASRLSRQLTSTLKGSVGQKHWSCLPEQTLWSRANHHPTSGPRSLQGCPRIVGLRIPHRVRNLPRLTVTRMGSPRVPLHLAWEPLLCKASGWGSLWATFQQSST